MIKVFKFKKNIMTYHSSLGLWYLSPDCEFSLPLENRKEWIYKYNPFNERESKRMNYSPAGDNGGGIYSWVYYQLGSNKEQFAVYQGIQISDPLMVDVNFGLHSNNANPSRVYFYPAEYNTFGSGSSVEMTYRFDGTDWVKHFKVTDHLGNIRSVLKDDGMGSYTLSGQYDYKPFGGIFNSYINADKHRQTFIGKESRQVGISTTFRKDNESSLGDFGVRKYDDFTGRFFQIDPLWEKYYSHTPYHYSANNPVSFLDPGGLAFYIDENGERHHDGNTETDHNTYATSTKDIEDLTINEDGEEKIRWDMVRFNAYLLPSLSVRKQMFEEDENGNKKHISDPYHGTEGGSVGNHTEWYWGGRSERGSREASTQVEKAAQDALKSGSKPTYYVHDHPNNASSYPTYPEDYNSIKALWRDYGNTITFGILIHTNTVTFFNLDKKVKRIPLSSFKPED